MELFMTKELYSKFLTSEEQQIIKELDEHIRRTKSDYDLSAFWLYDSEIGGIGGYSMPADPKKNPFKGGYTRALFRPIQYARCSMEIQDIRYSSRNIIRDLGLHLEFVLKFILKKKKPFKILTVNKFTLGKLSNLLIQNNYTSDIESETLNEITQIYNWSKHSINMDSQKESSFSVADSLVFYIIIRKLVTSLLKPYYVEIINELIRIDIEDRFLINLNKRDDLDFVK